MRSKEEIEEKLNRLYLRRLKERKRKYLCTSHLNCVFNQRHRVKRAGMVGFCQCPSVLSSSARSMVICNSESDAEKCGCYTCKNTEESVQRDFEEILRNPAKCGYEYPKLAILIWLVQNGIGSQEMSRRKRFLQLVRSLFIRLWFLISFRWW